MKSDEQVIRGCLKGRIEEYEHIVERYRTKFMNLAVNILENKEDAEDACQEAFIKVYKNLGHFNHNMKFKHWAYSILYNQCRDQLRKQSRFRRFFNRMKRQASVSSESSPENFLINSAIYKKYLKTLTPRERIVVYLWASEGYTSEEISSVLRCSSSTARVCLFQARKKIKSLLEKKDD